VNSLSYSLSTVHPFRRLLALGAAALVLLLTVLAVSPQLHTAFHGHTDDCAAANAQDEGCVVTLFAAGVTAAHAPLVVVAPPQTYLRAEFSPHFEIFVNPPRYLHQPERGPPSV
jgi:hypothetical protein